MTRMGYGGTILIPWSPHGDVNSCPSIISPLRAPRYTHSSVFLKSNDLPSKAPLTYLLTLQFSATLWTHIKGCRQLLIYVATRAVWKVRGFTLLLPVGILWMCGDGLFFEVPPLASDALLTMFYPLLENVLQTVCRKLQVDSGTGGFDLSRSFLRL
jgi:hypothetical protein